MEKIATTYVVHLLETDDPYPFKAFTTPGEAVASAENEVHKKSGARQADVYELTGIGDARAAVEAVIRGEGKFITARHKSLSEEQATRARGHELDIAWTRGPRAVLEALGLVKPSP